MIYEKDLKNFEKKSFGFGKKKSAPIPIPKLDLGFGRTLFCIAIIEIAHRRPYIQWLIHESLPLFCRQKCVQHSLQMQCTQWGLTLCRKIAVFVHRWFDEKIIYLEFQNFTVHSGATEFQNDLKNAFNSICNECIMLIIPG